jgi:hypothetical protein
MTTPTEHGRRTSEEDSHSLHPTPPGIRDAQCYTSASSMALVPPPFASPSRRPCTPTRTICEYTSRASGPETRITPIPPLPGGVDNAYIVFFSIGDGTTLVKNRLPRHSFRMIAFREDSITVGNGTEETDSVANVGNDHFSSFRSRFSPETVLL